jgi:hypothetical protein
MLPDTYYYIYTLVETDGGELLPLELTRVKTMPKDNSPFTPAAAEHVAVRNETTYDSTEVTLTPDASVKG